MKKLLIGLIAAGVFVAAEAAPTVWLTDLPKAQAQAKAENKFVLLDFTGSDWCPPCKMLNKNVLESPQFQAYAATNLVLVQVDFPHAKEQSAALKKANEALSEQYKVEYFPTLIVLDKDGKQMGQKGGYGGEDAAAYIADLGEIEKAGK